MKIPARYSGPPGSANGGVAAGMLAAHVDAPVVEVTLRRPPPLEVDMVVADGRLLDGEVLVAEAVAAAVDLAPREPVPVEVAKAAAEHFAGRTTHPFPGCFVCGTDREPPDGLGLRPGPVGDQVVAAVWTPQDDDRVMVWAALDCPGAWATQHAGRAIVLGRMAVQHLGSPRREEPHVVLGWTLGGEGRKAYTATALYGPDGEALAVSRATWIAIDVDKVGLR